MNLLYTIIALGVTFTVVGGLAVFIMNVISMVLAPLIGLKRDFTLRSGSGIFILSILHAYIFLSFISIVILLCHACTVNTFIKSILWFIAGNITILLTWSAYLQANNRSKEEQAKKYEQTHVVGIAINALISTIGFFVLAFFPSLIGEWWPWVEYLFNKLV